MKIALFGGSFDPIHRGHVDSARAAASWLGLDRVIFLPARRPPHKLDRELASPFDRYALIAASIVAEPWAELSPWELERTGTTYCWEQLEAFRAMRPADPLTLLIGADSLADLPGWRRAEEIVAATPIAVCPREPWDRSAAEAALPAGWKSRLRWFEPGEAAPAGISAGEIWVLPIAPVTISSTGLRRRLASGDDIGNDVPPPARELIRRHGLYGGSVQR